MAGPGVISFTRTEKYSSHLAEEIQQMRDDGDFTDFTISVNTDSVPCHRLILASHSPYIKTFLKSDKTETTKRSISLDHIAKETITLILDYVYCGQVSFTTEQLMDIINACDFLQMKVLKEMCIDEVPDVLEPANVIPWMKLAEKVKIAPIKARCLKIMVSSFAEISHSHEFMSMKYQEVHGKFAEVTKSAKDFDDVLRASMRWVNHEPENRSAHVEDLLQQVKPDNCSLQTVVDVLHTHSGIIMRSNEHVLRLLTSAISTKTITSKNEAKATQDTKMDTGTRETTNGTEAQEVQPTMQVGEASNTTQVSTTSVQAVGEENIAGVPTQTEEATANKKLVIIGGQVKGKVSQVCWILNKDKQFREFCKIPRGHRLALDHSVCQTPQGFAVTGGQGSALCLMYNALRKSWCELKNMLTQRCGHGSLCAKGVLCVIGGVVRGDISSSVHCLAMKDGRWQQLRDLPVRVMWPGVAGIEGMLYVLDKRGTHQLLRLDIAERVWVKRASFPSEGLTENASMTELNGKLCVAGGLNKCCALYDPSGDSWTMISQPGTRHLSGSLVHFGNKLLLLGGRSDGLGTDKVEECNVPDGRWEVSTITMPTSLRFHHALVLNKPSGEEIL